MQVEIVYALPTEQFVLTLEVAPGCCVLEALQQVQFSAAIPPLDWQTAQLGIFGKKVALSTVLVPYDRIEIYRPLQADPKTARRNRAVKKA